MWHVQASRGQYLRYHGRDAAALPDALNYATLTRVLGEMTPLAAQGNFEFLDTVMGSLHVHGSSGGRSSDGTYCGLATTVRTAESHVSQKGAWIVLASRYVDALERMSAIAVAFPKILAAALDLEQRQGEQAALHFLANVRGSVFHYMGVADGDVAPELDTPDVWDEFRSTDDCLFIARAAVLFTVAHELAHLTQGDCSTQSARRDHQLLADRTERATRALPPEVWPTRAAHRDEVVADRTAIDIALESDLPYLGIANLMNGSVVAGLVLAIDGWEFDRSSISETHPSPFMRLEALANFWCFSIGESREQESIPADLVDWPSPAQLEFFARIQAMAGWLGGRYREGRDRLEIFEDVTGLWGILVQAAGYRGAFFHSHA